MEAKMRVGILLGIFARTEPLRLKSKGKYGQL